VAVVIEDEGAGFSASALARLGEPFYSEKEGGMGLGLAVAKEICLAHGGGLVVENRNAGGAMVRVEFARNPSGSSSQDHNPMTARPILIIEDEHALGNRAFVSRPPHGPFAHLWRPRPRPA
jgi:hypothetical protein